VNLLQKTETRNLMMRLLIMLAEGVLTATLLFSAGLRPNATESNAPSIGSPLTASQVVNRMVEMNDRRAKALQAYTSVRTYHLELHGILNLHADMEVKMTYRYPGDKDFTILSQSGSAYIRNHVLKRLIEAENESSHPDEIRHTAITPENYDFELASFEHDGNDSYYILNVTPKVNRKYLFKGRIWVDDRDYAIARIEGQPAKPPSWWTTKVNFVAQYERVGNFWLPASNKSVTSVRVFGRSLLTIRYKDYDLTRTANINPVAPVKMLSSESPASMVLIPPSPANE
jgi:hypothetical protein